MNNIAVVYQTHYGTTLKYAEWIAESLDADLLNRKKVSVSDGKLQVQVSHPDKPVSACCN